MRFDLKIIVAAICAIGCSSATTSFAQDEGPFDESEPPFAPKIRRPGMHPEIVPESKTKLKKGDKKSSEKDTVSDDHIQELEKQLFELVNSDRAKMNQPPLKLSPRLSEMAKAHAQDMMKRNFFSHTNKDGLDAQARAAKMKIGIGVYENIAYQQGDIEDFQKVINLEKDFMSEPDGPKNHRYNILYPTHTSVGVGVVIKGDKLILVEEFTDAPPTGEN